MIATHPVEPVVFTTDPLMIEVGASIGRSLVARQANSLLGIHLARKMKMESRLLVGIRVVSWDTTQAFVEFNGYHTISGAAYYTADKPSAEAYYMLVSRNLNGTFGVAKAPKSIVAARARASDLLAQLLNERLLVPGSDFSRLTTYLQTRESKE
jgi:hypothetical protein